VTVTLSLTDDEALVLFDWLVREDEKRLPTAHEAEQKVLWGLEAQLERVLVEPLRPEYREMVAAARERIAGDEGTSETNK
jgi:hypothetical protein